MSEKYIKASECEKYFYEHLDDLHMVGAMNAIEEMPAADVAPVVRCKDCKFFHNEKMLYAANIIDEHADGICALRRSYTDNIEHTNVSINDFCSSGERIAIDEIKLLPCPFCGGEAILSKEEIPDGNISYHTARIKCDDCGCATRQYIIDGYYGSTDTVADCINAWNDRKQNNSTPVVLCKNCKYASTNEFGVSSAIVLCSFGITKSVRQVDDFCIYGEKRSPDDEY